MKSAGLNFFFFRKNVLGPSGDPTHIFKKLFLFCPPPPPRRTFFGAPLLSKISNIVSLRAKCAQKFRFFLVKTYQNNDFCTIYQCSPLFLPPRTLPSARGDPKYPPNIVNVGQV